MTNDSLRPLCHLSFVSKWDVCCAILPNVFDIGFIIFRTAFKIKYQLMHIFITPYATGHGYEQLAQDYYVAWYISWEVYL